MLHSILPTCLFLASSAPQDSAPPVDAMIARSNELKSFIATYQVHYQSKDAKRKGPEGSMRLVYRAPEDLLAEFKGENLRTLSVLSHGRVSTLVEKEGRPFQHAEGELGTTLVRERARIAHVFHEQFPSLGEVDEPAALDVFVRFSLKPGPDGGRPEFNFQAAAGRADAPLLDWLGRLKTSSATLTTEGDDVVWEPGEGFRVFIRKDSGFIERIVATYGGETKTVLELVDLALDTEVKDAEFRFAEIDPSVTDTSESLSKSLGAKELTTMRDTIHRKIRKAVEDGTLEWTSQARAGLGEVFQAFHCEFASLALTDSMRSARSNIDEFCRVFQEMKKSIPEGEAAQVDDLEAKRTEWEQRLREGVEKAVDSYVAGTVAQVEDARVSKISAETRALELEAAEAACRKSVVGPTLEYFTQQMDLARRGELPPAKD